MKKILFILSLCCVFMTGCGPDGKEISQTPQPKEIVGYNDKNINSEYYGTDTEAIKKHLLKYSNNYDSLSKANTLVFTLWEASGTGFWDSFWHKVEKKEKCSIDIISFTIEGDAIICYVGYDGKKFLVIEDCTRDQYSQDSYFEYHLSFMNSFDITEDGKKKKKIVLSNEKINSYNEYTKKKDSLKDEDYYTFDIVYNKEDKED